MIPLYSEKEFNLAKSWDMLPCKCVTCEKIFYREKRIIKRALNGYDRNNGNFCGSSCHMKSLGGRERVVCSNCGKEFSKKLSQIKENRNNFCSSSCSSTYNNKNKTIGNRRSKLELWLEFKLNSLYPNLEILFNNKEAISSELDVYIPSLKLAFELNGIFHYEPIFGQDKLNQIANNDRRKFQACIEQNIELCLIDTSSQKYVKESTSKKFLDIIVRIIEMRLENSR
jgi:hypothetical protein